jgi:hypothetical protein
MSRWILTQHQHETTPMPALLDRSETQKLNRQQDNVTEKVFGIVMFTSIQGTLLWKLTLFKQF